MRKIGRMDRMARRERRSIVTKTITDNATDSAWEGFKQSYIGKYKSVTGVRFRY